MNVPFLDLKAQYRSIRDEIEPAIAAVLESARFIKGPEVTRFEEAYAQLHALPYCVGVGNCTDALRICLHAAGLKQGGEILVPANTFIASSEAITEAGGKVVFVDVDPDTLNIDLAKLKAAINERTVGVLPVHLYGQMADMAGIEAIAKEHSLFVIEDAAQAVLGRQGDASPGTRSLAACFSFFPGKNLGAYGDAGGILSADEAFAKRARMFANHGRTDKYLHEFEGISSRLDTLQAAVLEVKCRHIRAWTEGRRRVAARYDAALADCPGIGLLKTREDVYHVYHLYVIRSEQRDALRTHLSERGIQSGIHYPVALPELPAYAYLGHEVGDFPVASAASREILSLPIYPEMTDAQVDYVIAEVRNFHSS